MPTDDDTVPVRRGTLRVMADWLAYTFSLHYRDSGLLITPEERELVRYAVLEAEAALEIAPDPERDPTFALEIAERELRILTDYVQRTLKLAGCRCPVSLIGCPPDVGLRCRLCDVAATDRLAREADGPSSD